MNNYSKKIFVECTYTNFSDLNTGIQRVVRKLVTLLPDIAKKYDFEVHPVILHNDTFIEIETLNSVAANKARCKKQLFIRAFRQVNHLSRKGISTHLPNPKIKHFLFAHRSEFGLNYLLDQYVLRGIQKAKQLCQKRQVEYPEEQHLLNANAGDILLLLDSSWHMDIWKAVEQLHSRGVHPIAITYDLIPILHPQFLNESLVQVFSTWFEQAAHHCDGFIAISKTVQGEVEKQLSETKGIELADKFTGHFTLGADFLNTATTQQAIRKPLELVFSVNRPKEKPNNTYLAVGTIEPRKNHTYLLDVFDQLWEQGFNMHLCLVGKCGWRNTETLSRIKKHRLYGKNLFLWHDLDDNELAYCYQHAQVLLFASHAEGFGLPIIEGLHFGLPVMASDIPVHKEVGQDKIQYFDISNPTDLVRKIVVLEKKGLPAPNDSTATFYWKDWKQSGQALMEQIIMYDDSKQSLI